MHENYVKSGLLYELMNKEDKTITELKNSVISSMDNSKTLNISTFYGDEFFDSFLNDNTDENDYYMEKDLDAYTQEAYINLYILDEEYILSIIPKIFNGEFFKELFHYKGIGAIDSFIIPLSIIEICEKITFNTNTSSLILDEVFKEMKMNKVFSERIYNNFLAHKNSSSEIINELCEEFLSTIETNAMDVWNSNTDARTKIFLIALNDKSNATAIFYILDTLVTGKNKYFRFSEKEKNNLIELVKNHPHYRMDEYIEEFAYNV